MSYPGWNIMAATSSLSTTQCLTESDPLQSVSLWKTTFQTDTYHLRLHDLFEAQVRSVPEAIAVVFEGESLTYGALNARANQLAHRLQALGVQPEVPVGICLQRSLEMIVGLLAIVKAGGAYVPLDPTYPKDRLAHIFADAQLKVVLTESALRSLLPEQGIEILCLDADWSAIAKESDENPSSDVSAENLAYIIYTSGSTGKPKGVLIEHRGAVNTILDINQRFRVTAQDRVLAVCSLNFDLSVYDVFGLLAAGGSIVVPSPAIAPDPKDWLALMVREQVTLWNSAPPVMQMLVGYLLDHAGRLPESLRLVMLSGDWIALTLPDQIQQLSAETVEIISLGGATEASIWSIFYPVEAIDPTWKSIPYGFPLTNQDFLILDEQLQPVPNGGVGELFIGGVGVARGYHNRPDLNATKFIPHPLCAQPGERLYRTGDLGRYMPDGAIEFLGRIDHQVKIRGFRVEMGEIEVVLAQHPALREAVVLAREDASGTKHLVAYLVPRRDRTTTDPTQIEIHQIRTFLKERLPDYMVPAAFVILESLPLTPNGKLDRKALPMPDVFSPSLKAATAEVAPQDAIEQQLVEIWQSFLGVQPIGVTDNFFELGGNSILSVRLWAQVEATFSTTLPLVTLFQAPTIQQLASHLRNPQVVPQCPSLVEIQPDRSGGKKPPLFFLHVLGRGLMFCRPLLPHLDPERAIYGLSTNIADEAFPSMQVEDLAAHYLQQIRTVQPEGPYYLAGISFGGFVAFEIAQRLHAQGQPVALVALLDSILTNAVVEVPIAQQFSDHWRYFKRLGAAYLWRKLQTRVWGEMQKVLTLLSHHYHHLAVKLCRVTGLPLSNALQDFIHGEQNAEAGAAYTPKVYPGRLALFKALDVNARVRSRLDLEQGWRQLTTVGLDVYPVPGSHLAMLQEPNVRVLGEQLKAAIAQS